MAFPDLIERFADVPLEVSAAIRIRPLRVSEILGLRAGELLDTQVPIAAHMAVFAGGARLGAGESSSVGMRLSVRVVEIGCRE